MTNRLVSIIVPIYNAEKYLGACIDSIINQTYHNLDIILVNDGSTDCGLEVCRNYAEKDSRIQVIDQTNKGVSAARNAGIDRASGEYLMFVDSDDELYPNAVEFLLEDADKYNADIVSAVKCNANENGEIYSIYEDKKCTQYTGIESLVLSLDYDRQTNSVCAKLFKKDAFHDVRFEVGKRINEDGFFLFQCYVKQPTVVQHNVCIYKYYVRNQSNSRAGFSEKYLDMIYFCERKKEIVNRDFPELSEKLLNMEVSTHLFFLEVLCRTKEKKYKQYQKESIKLVRRAFGKYRSNNSHERRMFKIVTFGLYPLYKEMIIRKYGYARK